MTEQTRQIGEIDRTNWGTREEPGLEATVVTIDGYDCGEVYYDEDAGGWLAIIDDTDVEETFDTPELAVEAVKRGWAEWWKQCSDCGGPVTDEDKAKPGLHEAHHVTCAQCVREAGVAS